MPIEKPIGVALLPDSRLKTETTTHRHVGLNWQPIFCANCGKEGGFVPEDVTFAFYICTPCSLKCGDIDGMYMVPDEVFFQEVKNAQIEKYGKELTENEIRDKLMEDSSLISTLGRSRK